MTDLKDTEKLGNATQCMAWFKVALAIIYKSRDYFSRLFLARHVFST